MTNPGFQAQQAAQQAQQQAVQQNIRNSTESAAQARRAAELGRPRPQYYAYRRSPVRTGLGLVGRLIAFVVTLVGIAVAVGIFLLVLNRANPGAVHHIGQWLGHLF
jgi:sorbitol-specific phosphotransferase system component IIBC